ncbi:hypothetical protein EI546_09025 [Aequorivita sp. H23M31]|uniref:Lipoprotein n=1 Tax=Aequorivita ciconiae TaxID=2494375 RepID=A0A410G3J8_9FLAO|nr:hypothetical protein [Aequorivita sp. H23M31]QAA81852.1 hypothetical protein EI546_09025 [Aequorivita sp. H23M31]
MRLTITILVALVLCSCGDKKIEDSQMFVGAYRMMDQLVPYPYIFQQKKDSVFLFDNTGNLIDKIVSKGIEDTTGIQFEKHHFKILKIKENGFFAYNLLDTLNFQQFKNGIISPKSVAKFEKLAAVKKLDIEEIQNKIGNSIWNYDVIEDENSNPNEDLKIKQLLHFRNDSLNIITEYYYEGLKTVSEYETKAYHIFQIDQNYFLSFQKEVDNPQPIYQIIGADSQTVGLRDFSSREIKNIKFVKDSTSTEYFKDLIKNTAQYSKCFDGYQGEYYYGDDVTYKKGNNYIVEYVNIDAPKNDMKSGYIIIHYTVNCRGNLGNFGLIQMNRDFKKTSFKKEMVNHLLNKVSLLNDFPSSVSEKEWLKYKDVHGFLMFKLEKGKIVDLCP